VTASHEGGNEGSLFAFNMSKEHCTKYVQLGNTFNLLHAAASFRSRSVSPVYQTNTANSLGPITPLSGPSNTSILYSTPTSATLRHWTRTQLPSDSRTSLWTKTLNPNDPK